MRCQAAETRLAGAACLLATGDLRLPPSADASGSEPITSPAAERSSAAESSAGNSSSGVPASAEEDAAAFLTKWHKSKGPQQPNHPKLLHYSTRRTAHLLKLSMIAAASNGGELTIKLSHVQEALDWLIEAESFMPDIFKAMTTGGDSRVIEDTWYHIYNIWIKEKKPISEHRIIHFLQERVPSHNVLRILDVMVRVKILEKELGAYVPKSLKGS